jgi:inner membrane protein
MHKVEDSAHERARAHMLGKSHLLIGLAAGVVFDSITHVSGHPLTGSGPVETSLLVSKVIYYFSVGFGALLPDIDNARSTMGRRFGRISKEIQHLAGHRTIFHSLLGLLIGCLLALGLEQLVSYLFTLRGITPSTGLVNTSHLIFIGVLFGSIIHIATDALTTGGVPLFWPDHKRYGFPPNAKARFHTGTWPERLIVWSVIILVGIGVWQSFLIV